MNTKLSAIFMTATKTIFLSCIFVLVAVLLVPVTTYAACDLRGAWYGYDENGDAYWINRVDGRNTRHGTMALEVPGFDLTLGGTFPNAVGTTVARGPWERTKRNTYEYALLFLVVNAGGGIEWVGKLTGTDTMNKNCDELAIESRMYVYNKDQDFFFPYEQAIMAIDFPTLTGHVMYFFPSN